ncbi:MAG: hypothetical protein ABIK97_07925 [candidate division WOR-3 bacterium]
MDFKPFEMMQIDTKVVVDGLPLPSETYRHLLLKKREGLPLYQFTLIDIRTRLRFIAYAQENSFINGLTFIILVLLWLRAFGIRGKE